jgi:signal transduction histidine kinase
MQGAAAAFPASRAVNVNHDTLDALAAIHRVASALTAPGALPELASAALSEMRDSLGLEVAAMYLAEDDDREPRETLEPVLREFAVSASDAPAEHVTPAIVLDPEAWRLLTATRGPLVFGEGASWLLPNPFDSAMNSWLVLPLHSQGGIVGTVVGGAATRIALDPAGVMVLSALGNLLGAGVATARLRMEVQRTAVQRERMRLAAELHDGLAQDLALAVRELSLVRSDPLGDGARASWARLSHAIESAHRVVRAGLEDLSVVVPVSGVCAAISELCDRFRQRGIAVSAHTTEPGVEIAPEIFSTVLRVVQESLANVARHAGGARASVRLSTENELLRLEVLDDGAGITQALPAPGDGHFGIWIMRERARSVGGFVDVTSRDEGGTAVTLTIPLQRSPERAN